MASQALRQNIAASLSAASRDATNLGGRRFVVRNQVFTPKVSVAVKCGSETVSVYPILSPTDPLAELSHAFHVTMTALKATSIPPRQQFQFLTDRMGLTSQAIALRQDLMDEFTLLWEDPANMEVINYRNDEGQPINNCRTQAGNLKPIQNGPAASCRPNRIKYVTVRSVIDFIDGQHFQFVHTIELPMQAVQVQRGGHMVNLDTYVGVDPLTLTREEFRNTILLPLYHDQPFELKEPGYGEHLAGQNIVKFNSDLEDMLHRLHYPVLADRIFAHLCPNYRSDPCSAAQEIHQVSADELGNEVVLALEDYQDHFYKAIRPLMTVDPLPMHLSQQFVSHLEPVLKKALESKFSTHLTMSDLSRRAQTELLHLTVTKARECDKELNVTLGLIHRSQQAAHTMMATAISAAATTPFDPTTSDPFDYIQTHLAATTNISQAEQTLRDNQGAGAAGSCWGCKQVHPGGWWDKKLNKPNCPHAHEDWAQKNAKIERDKFNKKRKNEAEKRRNRYNKKRKADEDSTSAVTTVSLDGPSITAVVAGLAAHASSAASVVSQLQLPPTVAQLAVPPIVAPVAAPTSAANAGGVTGTHIGALRVLNFNLTTQLPIAVHPALPHINIAFGMDYHPEECTPVIPCMLDSCAAVNTARLQYIMAIMRRFPHIVKSITDCKDGRHSPLTLAGVIGNSSSLELLSTKLPVLVELFTPYKKKSGEQVIISFACGDALSCNVILGMPFWKEHGIILDATNDKATSPYLEGPSFDVFYRVPSMTTPDLPARPVPVYRVPTDPAKVGSALTALALHYRLPENPVPVPVPPVDIDRYSDDDDLFSEADLVFASTTGQG